MQRAVGSADERRLREAARQRGWQDVFWDGLGVKRQTSFPALQSLMRTTEKAESETSADVIVARAGACGLQLKAEMETAKPKRTELILEDGEHLEIGPGQMAIRNKRWEIRLGRALPLGVHRLTIERGKKTRVVHVLAAPKRLEVPTNFPKLSVFLPLYAAHGRLSMGIGDLRDLGELVQWAGRRAGALVGTLPLFPTFGGSPVDVSPYRPETRLFWNEAHVDPRGAPEFAHPSVQIIAQGARWRQALAQACETAYVDYGCVGRVKSELLGAMARVAWADAQRRADIDAWARRTAEAEAYARFRAKLEGGGAEAAWYHLYTQSLAQEQIAAAAHAGGDRGGLYLDLPVGVHPEGYDARQHPDLFLRGVSVGAPPDALQERGQVWGMPPTHPTAGRNDGYGHLRLILRRIFAVARMLRIDHVMGLQRLYCVPEGADGRDGAYLNYPAEELYAAVMIEAARARAVVVGENLGTLPEGMNEALAQRGLLGMHVQQFALSARRRAIGRAQAGDVTALNTHDTPTFAAYWKDDDIDLRQQLGVTSAQEARQGRVERMQVRTAVTKELRRMGIRAKGAREVGRALMLIAAKGPACVQVMNVEDWWGAGRAEGGGGWPVVVGAHHTRPGVGALFGEAGGRAEGRAKVRAGSGQIEQGVTYGKQIRMHPWAFLSATARESLAGSRGTTGVGLSGSRLERAHHARMLCRQCQGALARARRPH